MSKQIGLIAEDDSDVSVITEIIAKYLDRNKFSIKKFVGNGCGKLKQKCDSWVENLVKRGCHHIVLIHDLDRADEGKLRKQLLDKIGEVYLDQSIVIIPIEELEAWLLAGNHAIKEVFSLEKSPVRIHNCETIESPKEHLRDLVWKMGKKRYLNTIHNIKIAEKISIHDLLRCSSFVPLDKFIKERICA